MKIYLASVSLIYGFFVLWFLTRSKLVLARKIKTVMKRTQMRATLETGPSVDEDQLKEEAVERIESRFSNIRRLVIPIVTSIYSLLVFIPFLGYVPGTYLSIVVGSIGFTIGIAAKPYVENLISGLIMSYGRSVRIGDTVEIDNQYGTVEDIALTYTVVKVWDWKRYIIPNALVLQKEILNYSLNDKDIWAYVEFHVSPEADLDLVKQLALDSVRESDFYRSDEEPHFWVMGLEENSVRCWAAGWASNPSEAWELKSDMRLGLSKKLRENGIETHKWNLPAASKLRVTHQEKHK